MMKRFLTAAAVLVAISQSNAKADLSDGSFETPHITAGSYVGSTGTAGSPWSFTGSSGLVSNGSAFGNPNAVDGTQAAFVQYNGSPQEGDVAQSFSGLSAGTYTLSLYVATRLAYGTSSFTITVDNTQVFTINPTSAAYTLVTQTVTLTSGTNTIDFRAKAGSTGDTTTFIDNVKFAAVPVPASALLLGSGLSSLLVVARRRKTAI